MPETNKPEVEPEDIISIGEGLIKKKAIVCSKYENNEIDAIYFDNSDKPIKDSFYWENGNWEFKNNDAGGVYVDKVPRWANYIALLRNYN